MLWNIDKPGGLRTPAFTLLETVLTLIVGVLVCVLSFKAIGYVRSSFKEFNKGQDHIRHVLLFKNALDGDAGKCSAITVRGNEIKFSGIGDTVTYYFWQAVYRRSAKGIDSFTVSVRGIEKSSIRIDSDREVVSKIKFDILEPINIKGVELTKYYSSADLMSLKQQNEPWNH